MNFLERLLHRHKPYMVLMWFENRKTPFATDAAVYCKCGKKLYHINPDGPAQRGLPIHHMYGNQGEREKVDL